VETIEIIIIAFNAAAAIIGLLFGWFLKILDNRLSRLEAAEREAFGMLAKLREELPSNYVRRDQFKDSLDNIFTMLRRIDEKLDTKVDK
jgi:hypothetical protein